MPHLEGVGGGCSVSIIYHPEWVSHPGLMMISFLIIGMVVPVKGLRSPVRSSNSKTKTIEWSQFPRYAGHPGSDSGSAQFGNSANPGGIRCASTAPNPFSPGRKGARFPSLSPTGRGLKACGIPEKGKAAKVGCTLRFQIQLGWSLQIP